MDGLRDVGGCDSWGSYAGFYGALHCSRVPLLGDRYEVLRLLGRGAFAETLLARDTALGRQVALKVLHPRHLNAWKTYELFEREAAVLRDLRHPGIPVVHVALDVEWEGAKAAVLVMEYIEGDTLAALIAEHRHLDLDDVTHWFVEMLGLLDYLHTRVPPVLHRDIKPANIIIRTGGTPALVDFGAVRNVFLDTDEAGSTMVGTYGYMPYEQTMGQAGPSSDLYALAATFLHLLTGRSPADFMDGDNRIVVPQTLPHGERFRDVLSRMLAPTPTARFSSARDARSAFVAPAAGTAMVPLAPSLPPGPRPLTGVSRDLYRNARYTMWQLANSDGEPDTDPTLIDAVLLGVFSVLTVGVLPAVLGSRALARQRRVKLFVREGTLTTAEVLEVTVEKIEFGCQLTRIKYSFQADGTRRVGSDRVIPSMAERWEVGSIIQVIYLGAPRPCEHCGWRDVSGASSGRDGTRHTRRTLECSVPNTIPRLSIHTY